MTNQTVNQLDVDMAIDDGDIALLDDLLAQIQDSILETEEALGDIDEDEDEDEVARFEQMLEELFDMETQIRMTLGA